MEKYDVIVIGTGTAGSTVAHKCNSSGKKVAIIDHRPFGGTCALRGCDPKKVLVGGAELVDWNNRMKDIAGLDRDTNINWSSLISFKNTFTQSFPDMIDESFRSHGIHAYHGLARFFDDKTIEVGDNQIEGEYIVIATGSNPRNLDIPGDENIITSDEFMELNSLPKNIVFLGGGYISFEFANVAARAGSKPVILQSGDQPLKPFDPDMVDAAVKASKDAGLDILTNHRVVKIEKKGDQYEVITENENQETFTTDLVVHGGGRIPNIDELELDKGNVEVHKKGIAVNEYMQSPSNPRVYAAGDCSEE
ncbi:MAG: dihydrolipoyl dehydrogenase family protein, partial [Methanohalobium sp.]|uniref:dihydrolipoyl dehydrogenase family protein n=1 Tax=Methanohalobium sp. TaxID=2837493 RepID=UPI00397E25CE